MGAPLAGDAVMELALLTAEDKARFDDLQEDVEPEEGELPLTEAALLVWVQLKAIVLGCAQRAAITLRGGSSHVAMFSRRDGGLGLVIDSILPWACRLSIYISADGTQLSVYWLACGSITSCENLPWDPNRVAELVDELFAGGGR